MTNFATTLPADSLKIGHIPQWFRDVQIIMRDLLQREHATVAGTYATITGAEHKAGSAKAYVQDAAPTKRPDTSTNLSADDAGRIWFDSDDDYLMHIYDGTDWDTTVETMINAMDGLNLAEDFAIGTDKFTVAAADGDTAIAGDITVGGILEVTGVATLADGSKMASDAAPTADEEIANKKYVDTKTTAAALAFSDWTTEDADSAAMEQSVSYTAASDGFVCVNCNVETNDFLNLQVDSTVQYSAFNVSGAARAFAGVVPVKSGAKFVASHTGTAGVTISWMSIGTLAKPTK